MINETALRETLVSLAELNKHQYLLFSSVLDELVALRETVRGLDPTFGDVMDDRRKKQEDSSKQIVSDQLGLYDGIIQKLKTGEGF